MSGVPFNVNDYVWVKLTEHGLRILERQYNELVSDFPSMGQWEPPHTNEDGWTRFQLWDLMNQLGPYTTLGWMMPFDTEIKIEHRRAKR